MVKNEKRGEFRIDDDRRRIVKKILSKLALAEQEDKRITLIGRRALNNLLADPDEIKVINRVYRIKPKLYGFEGPKLGIKPIPKKLVEVPPQPFRRGETQLRTETQFVPNPAYDAYQRMAAALRRDTGQDLLVESSLRSDAYQAYLFLYMLGVNKFDINLTGRRVAIPGYSEHGDPDNPALDFLTSDGFPTEETPGDFANTVQYEWLASGNANRYGFYESYPIGNPYAMPEPWHWRFTEIADDYDRRTA